AEAVVDASHVLVLVDRRRSARTAEVDGRLAAVGGRNETQKLARVILDPVLGNDVIRERQACQRIIDVHGGAGKIACPVGRRRYKRRPPERTRNLTAGLPIEEKERTLLAVVHLRDRQRSSEVGPELV